MPRLPIPGKDAGTWGDILNDYLLRSHQSDGSLKDNVVTNSAIAPHAVTAAELATDAVTTAAIADGSITESQLDTLAKTKLNATGDWNTLAGKPAIVAAGADKAAARSAIDAQSQLYYMVKEYGAKGDGTTDDTAAIQAALDAAGAAGGGTVFLPRGTYIISTALNLSSLGHKNVYLKGEGAGFSWGTDVITTTIKQVSPNEHGITATIPLGIKIEDLAIVGPDTGTGNGVNFLKDGSNPGVTANMENVFIQKFGGWGIYAELLISSNFRTVHCWYNTLGGAYFNGGTSLTFDSCFHAGNAGYGWRISHVNYSVWNACASDDNDTGWLFDSQVTACTLNGCGTENNTTDGLVTDNIYSLNVNGFFISRNHRYGVWCKGDTTYSQVFLNNIWEDASTGATYGIFLDNWHVDAFIINSACESPMRYDGNVTSVERGVIKNSRLINPVIADTNNKSVLQAGTVANAVNYLQVRNAATAGRPGVYAAGSDTNIDLDLYGKGTGVVRAGGVPVATTTGAQTLSNKLLDPATTTFGLDPIAGNIITIPRWAASGSGSLASGRVQFTYFTADKTQTVSNIMTISAGTAAGATPTLCRLGIYSVDSSNNMTLIGASPNDTTLWAAPYTQYTSVLSAPVSLTAGGKYAIGALVVTAAAVPMLCGVGGVVIGNEASTGTRISSITQTGQTDLASTYTAAASNWGTGFMVYARMN